MSKALELSRVVRGRGITSDLGPFRNKFINPDFSIDQRAGGTRTVAPNSSTFVADRWIFYNGTNQAATVDLARASLGTILSPSGGTHIRISFATAPTSGAVELFQRIENVETLSGRKATITAFVRGPDGVALNVFASQHFGTGGTPSETVYTAGATGAFSNDSSIANRRFGVLNVPSVAGKTRGSNANDNLRAGLSFTPRVTGPFLIDDISIVEGDASFEQDPTSRRHPSQELALCQRYFWRIWGSSVWLIGNKAAGSGAVRRASFQLPVPMRARPSISVSGNAAVFTSGGWVDGALSGEMATDDIFSVRIADTTVPATEPCTLIRLADAAGAIANILFDAEL